MTSYAEDTFFTEDDLAARLKITRRQAQVLRRKHDWDHIGADRNHIRYTTEQFNTAIASLVHKGETRLEDVNPLGQTTLSRRRSA